MILSIIFGRYPPLEINPIKENPSEKLAQPGLGKPGIEFFGLSLCERYA